MKPFNRRKFIQSVGAVASLATVNQMFPKFLVQDAFAAPVGGRKLLYIFEDGGNDWLSRFTHDAIIPTIQQIRPTISQRITQGQFLRLGATSYSIHPQFATFQAMFNSGEASFVQQVGPLANTSGSHDEARKDYQTGVNDGRSPENAGWIQRIALTNPQLFTESFNVFDRTGGDIATSGGAYRALQTRNLASLNFNNYARGQNGFRLATAFSVINQSGVSPEEIALQQAYGQVEQSVAAVATAIANTTINPVFPNTGLGQQLRDIFIAFVNFPTRIATAIYGGHDLHNQTDPFNPDPAAPLMGQASLANQLDQAVAAFRANCQRVGIWNDIIINVSTEFGRTNRENGNQGTDHARATLSFLAGGAVQGGQVVGPVPTTEELLHPRNALIPKVAVSDVYADCVAGLGLNPAPVFVGHTRTPLGLIKA